MPSTTVSEPARQTKLAGEYQIVIVGGGIAGVAAAMAAARRGGKVALIEKQCGLGGLATLANVVMYLPICDGRGRQVMSGITEELLHLSVTDVKEDIPEQKVEKVPQCWIDKDNPALAAQRIKNRFSSSYNPDSFMLEMEKLLITLGVEIFYDTRFCGCLKNGDAIDCVLVENKSGRLALKAEMFIDCSGDADLCDAAGCATDNVAGNTICGWYYYQVDGKVRIKPHTRHYDPEFSVEKGTGPFFSGIDGRDVSQQVIQTRQDMREFLDKVKEDNPGSAVYPMMLPSIPSFRATRRLAGDFTLSDNHRHQWFDDSIGLTGDWREAGPVWALPIGTLRNQQKCPNLFVAGRCISADLSVWDVTRVIPTCALTGEAAAAAAMQLIDNKKDNKLDINSLQNDLRACGNLIDPELVKEQESICC